MSSLVTTVDNALLSAAIGAARECWQKIERLPARMHSSEIGCSLSALFETCARLAMRELDRPLETKPSGEKNLARERRLKALDKPIRDFGVALAAASLSAGSLPRDRTFTEHFRDWQRVIQFFLEEAQLGLVRGELLRRAEEPELTKDQAASAQKQLARAETEGVVAAVARFLIKYGDKRRSADWKYEAVSRAMAPALIMHGIKATGRNVRRMSEVVGATEPLRKPGCQLRWNRGGLITDRRLLAYEKTFRWLEATYRRKKRSTPSSQLSRVEDLLDHVDQAAASVAYATP